MDKNSVNQSKEPSSSERELSPHPAPESFLLYAEALRAKEIALPRWKRVVLRLIGIPIARGAWEARLDPYGEPVVLARIPIPSLGTANVPERETES